jgi:alanyl-tRNA synthetase
VAIRVDKALDQHRDLQKQIADLKRQLTSGAGDPAAEARVVGDAKVLALRSPVNEPAAMREYADRLREKLGNAVVVLGAQTPENKVILICTVAKGLVGRYHAGKIVKELAAVVGGTGGGKPDMAQAGGPDAARLDEALARAYAILG